MLLYSPALHYQRPWASRSRGSCQSAHLVPVVQSDISGDSHYNIRQWSSKPLRNCVSVQHDSVIDMYSLGTSKHTRVKGCRHQRVCLSAIFPARWESLLQIFATRYMIRKNVLRCFVAKLLHNIATISYNTQNHQVSLRNAIIHNKHKCSW
jgi:hypothetical protein